MVDDKISFEKLSKAMKYFLDHGMSAQDLEKQINKEKLYKILEDAL